MTLLQPATLLLLPKLLLVTLLLIPTTMLLVSSGSNVDYEWLDVPDKNVNQLVEDERSDADPLLEKSAWKVAVAYLFINLYDAEEDLEE
jgi:hypothetical protein